MMSRAHRIFLLTVLSCTAIITASCTSSPLPVNVDSKGVAIKGFDTVAYFTEGKPVKGNEEFQFHWNGATWLFSSNEHLELFKASPEKYAPQYGGYWAYAVSRGSTADIDPQHWKIVDGKLYLNLNTKVQKMWLEDMAGHIKSADQNWPGVIKK